MQPTGALVLKKMMHISVLLHNKFKQMKKQNKTLSVVDFKEIKNYISIPFFSPSTCVCYLGEQWFGQSKQW